MSGRQIALDLPAREARTRQDFFASPANAAALQAVGEAARWPGGRMLLTGPEGAGKSHLAHLWVEETGAVLVEGRALAGADPAALAARGRVAVDDADGVAGDGETALFHLHNLLAGSESPGSELAGSTLAGSTLAGSGRLLLTARLPPRDWGLRLADLLSRMQAIAITPIAAPDDALLAAVLVKLFDDRQVAVPAALIPYLTARIERSVAAARRIVAALDARALAERRPVSVRLASELLAHDDLATSGFA